MALKECSAQQLANDTDEHNSMLVQSTENGPGALYYKRMEFACLW